MSSLYWHHETRRRIRVQVAQQFCIVNESKYLSKQVLYNLNSTPLTILFIALVYQFVDRIVLQGFWLIFVRSISGSFLEELRMHLKVTSHSLVSFCVKPQIVPFTTLFGNYSTKNEDEPNLVEQQSERCTRQTYLADVSAPCQTSIKNEESSPAKVIMMKVGMSGIEHTPKEDFTCIWVQPQLQLSQGCILLVKKEAQLIKTSAIWGILKENWRRATQFPPNIQIIFKPNKSNLIIYRIHFFHFT